MKKKYLFLLLLFCQSIAFSQDKKIMKIVKYIEKSKGAEAKEILDELDTKPEYQTDIYYWYVRTIYYRNAALENEKSTNDLAEARKSFDKLIEFDKKDPSKTFTEYIPQIRKDLYEGKNQLPKKDIIKSSKEENKPNEEGKSVTLTQIGEGKTKDEAKYNALRNALEQAFGVYISSNTTILNDNLIKDEIVSFSSGNIEDIKIISETLLPNGKYSSVVEATVSIGKLIKFCESKGINVEFKGSLFATNIKMQKIKEKNQSLVLYNLIKMVEPILAKGVFNYTIKVKEPIKHKDEMNNQWIIPLNIRLTFNENIESISELIENTFKAVSMKPEEILQYNNQKIRTYTINFNKNYYTFSDGIMISYLKRWTSINILSNSINFNIDNSISKSNFGEILHCINQRQNNCSYILEAGKKNFSDFKVCNITISDLSASDWYYNRFEYFTENYKIDKVLNYDGYGTYSVNTIYNFNFKNHENNFIEFNIFNLLTLDEIEKIKEYKVHPIK